MVELIYCRRPHVGVKEMLPYNIKDVNGGGYAVNATREGDYAPVTSLGMDSNRSSGYYEFLKDPDLASPFGETSTQGEFGHHDDDFPYAHAQFPPYSTQPPTAAAAGNAGPASGSRSGVRQRVQANPLGQDDGRGRMYYTRDEDLRLLCILK
uniref:Uncharacterized protein n=1 Tax=Oryza punctata TaxID=4537 RepID=A0A0E0LAD8_ORYPU